jgi:hypothetical protein
MRPERRSVRGNRKPQITVSPQASIADMSNHIRYRIARLLQKTSILHPIRLLANDLGNALRELGWSDEAIRQRSCNSELKTDYNCVGSNNI